MFSYEKLCNFYVHRHRPFTHMNPSIKLVSNLKERTITADFTGSSIGPECMHLSKIAPLCLQRTS